MGAGLRPDPNALPSLYERFVLTDYELRLCREVGQWRFDNCVASGVKPRNYTPDALRVAIDIDGVVGEYAFARMMNLCPDFTISPRSGGYDLLTHQGQTVDVKTTRRANGQLLGEIKKRDSYSDIYVLMVVDDVSATFVGWAKGRDLFSARYLTDLGHGPTYVMPQAVLRRDFL